MAIKSFKCKASEDICEEILSKKSLKVLPKSLHHKCRVRFTVLSAASTLEDLKTLRGNRFEALKGSRKNQYSIRINRQYRICFSWIDKNVCNVEVVDYH